MINEHGPAFTFWLSYLDSRGGLWERSGDTVLTVLPEHLGAEHALPETALVTDDPDIAREDGVLFLGAGHPEIDKGAETVIDTGDVGTLTVPHSTKSLSTDDLLAKIRDHVPVDHGRVDATGSIIRSHRALLRLEALATHAVSADEQFTEVVECLIDVPSRIPWPQSAADRLHTAMAAAEATSAPRSGVSPYRLTTAVAVAHRELDATAAKRVREMATGADIERAAEIARASEYYTAALAAIDKRRTGADPQRRDLLDARARATAGERDRRLAEIDEKYRPQHALRPYRLYLVDLPVWRLATDVRRGERRWPVIFDYLPLLGTVAATRCPTCDVHSPLVATKTHLGCETCVPARAPVHLAPAAAPPQPDPARKPSSGAASTRRTQPRDAAPTSTPTPARDRATPPAAAPPRPLRPVAPLGPFLPGRPEERKVTDFWNHVGVGDTRKLSRLVAPESPLAALIRLYGAAGPLTGIGVPPGQTLVTFTCGNYDRPVAGERGGTAGELRTGRGAEYPYLLLWSPAKVLDEIFPYSTPWHPGRARMLLKPVTEVPTPRVELDVVAQLLLSHTSARHGLTFAARTLAAWWRLPDPDALLTHYSPAVLAASIDRAVRYWSGLAGTGYSETAKTFRADEAAMRKATPALQKHLQLSQARNW